MNNTVQTYAEIWNRRGRVDARRAFIPHGMMFGELATLLVLSSGLISAFDLRLMRMLFDAVYPDVREKSDDALMLFLAMMAASLNQGNVYFPRGAAMAAEYERVLRQAMDACGDEDVVKEAFCRAWYGAKAGDNGRSERGTDVLTQECCRAAEQFEAAFAAGTYESIIGETTKPLKLGESGWYFERYYTAETQLRELLMRRFTAPAMSEAYDGTLARILGEIFEAVKAGRRLDSIQKAAVALSCVNTTTVISGGPGTGKTTVAAYALLALTRFHADLLPDDDIVITAPTGRAAARLQESLAATIVDIAGADEREKRLMALRGRTVHGMLGYDPATGGFRHGAKNPVASRVVVVDEASMLDVTIFRRLLEALHDDAVLILLGDRNQLPSVEAGAVLGDIAAPFYQTRQSVVLTSDTAVPSIDGAMRRRLETLIDEPLDPALLQSSTCPLTNRFIVLTVSHRSQRAVSDFAHLINIQRQAENAPGRRYMFQATVHLFANPPTDPAQMASAQAGVYHTGIEKPGDTVGKWMTTYLGTAYADAVREVQEALERKARPAGGLSLESVTAAARDCSVLVDRLFGFLESSMILCVVRTGECGSGTANATALNIMRPLLDDGNRDASLFNGCMALVTRNQPLLNLWNGDRGIILAVSGRTLFLIRRPAGFAFIAPEEIAGLEPSFAMTVHKAQGSEFGSVLLVLPKRKNHYLMTREILYTALTRAKTHVLVAGEAEAFDAAIGREVSRRSALICARPEKEKWSTGVVA